MKKKSIGSFFAVPLVTFIVTILVVTINPVSILMAQEGTLDTRGAEKGLIKGGVGVGSGAGGQGYTFVINVATQWFDTGIDIKEGDKIIITAISSKTDPPCDGNTGCPPYREPDDVIEDGFAGSGLKALVGRIGTTTEGSDDLNKNIPFSIGGELLLSAPKDGRLYIGYNDCAGCFSDNTGAFEVMINVEKP